MPIPPTMRARLYERKLHDSPVPIAEIVKSRPEEINSLYQVIEEEVGPLAADGGYLGDDIYGNLPPTSWQKLTRIFLNT